METNQTPVFSDKDLEEVFLIWPQGVRYKCPRCETGEMKAVQNGQVMNEDLGRMMFWHNCTNCDTKLQLPKVYPYIDWIPVEGGVKFLDPKGLKHFTELLIEKLDQRYQKIEGDSIG